MTIIHYHLLDPITNKCITEGSPAPNGRTHPPIPGLDVQVQLLDGSFVAFLPDGTNVDLETGINVILQEDMETLITNDFNQRKLLTHQSIHQYAKQLRSQVVDDWYHASELSYAASIKIDQAKLAQAAVDESAAQTAAPYIAAEASFRGITTKQLADIIVSRFYQLQAMEAKFSGIRGAKCDAVTAIQLDFDDFLSAYRELGIIQRNIENGWN